MSTETKYLVMEELIGVPAAAIEKAEEQASRIIQIVAGRRTKEEVDKCSLRGVLESESPAYKPLSCSKETLDRIEKSGLIDPEGDYSASVHHPEFRPKHTTKPTKESLKLTNKIVSLRAKGLHWHQIAAKVGLSKEAARKRYREWEKRQNENDLPPMQALIKKIEPLLYEPGAEEAAAEAKCAEEVLKSASQNERGPTKDEQIDRLVAAMDSQNALDIEILQAVQRQFSGCGLTVADVRARRQKTCY